jgi:2,3-dihydroxybiphenyl 1,2-dioxygenase
VIEQLGYFVFQVSDAAAWERFATGVLGLGLGARHAGGGFGLRLDGWAQRFVIEPGGADDLGAIGLRVSDGVGLDAAAERLSRAGVEVVPGSPELARARRVARLIVLRDPAGIPLELFTGPELAEPFQSVLVRSGFVAGELGAGHVVVTAPDPGRSRDFYERVLGFRLSDEIHTELWGHRVDLAFFHVGRRHHTIAFGGAQKKRLHHFMLEVGSVDDVGHCLDRTLAAGHRIVQTLGRHPNDRMLSFYARTPSGFQFECGWGGREIDDARWKPASYDRISEWGHHPPQAFAPRGPKP